MNKIKCFLFSYYQEILSVGSLFLIFSYFVLVFGGHLAHVIIDFGREAYFPYAMLKGKILYKDLFNVYGPLGYQLNALLYKIFGASLNTLRIAGVLNSLVIVYLFYAITRQFSSRTISWGVTVFLMVTCVADPLTFNYIFPYAYSMDYAFGAFLFSILFLILYFKQSKEIFIPLSWFFVGVSLASKYDYFLYIILFAVLTAYLIHKQKLNLKYGAYSLLSFLSVPCVCFLILFLQGLTFSDFLNSLAILKAYVTTDSLKYFYLHSGGLYPQWHNLIAGAVAFLKFVPAFLILLGILYFSFKKNKLILALIISFIVIYGIFPFILFPTISIKILAFLITHKFMFLIPKIFGTLGNLFALQRLCFKPAFIQYPFSMFPWLPIFTFLVFCLIIIRNIKTKNFSKDWPYILLIVIALLSCMKSFFFLYAYAEFTFPLLLIANTVLLTEYLPDYIKVIDKKLLKKSFLVILLGLTLVYFRNSLLLTNRSPVVKTNNGSFSTLGNLQRLTQGTLDYLNTINKNDVVWVIPEGLMFNFLSGHPMPLIYDNITPTYLQVIGEEKIISDIEKTPPDYVIINNRDSSQYGYKFFCDDYGFKICKYINSNYTEVKKLKSEMQNIDFSKVVIYKKK